MSNRNTNFVIDLIAALSGFLSYSSLFYSIFLKNTSFYFDEFFGIQTVFASLFIFYLAIGIHDIIREHQNDLLLLLRRFSPLFGGILLADIIDLTTVATQSNFYNNFSIISLGWYLLLLPILIAFRILFFVIAYKVGQNLANRVVPKDKPVPFEEYRIKILELDEETYKKYRPSRYLIKNYERIN